MSNKTGAKLNTKPPVDQLTPIEAKIWEAYQTGKPFSQIADELEMKVISVRRRMTTIREKIAIQTGA